MPMLDVMSPGIPNGLSQQLGGLADTLIQSPMKLAQMRMEQQRLNNESMYRQLMGQAMIGRSNAMQERAETDKKREGAQEGNYASMAKAREARIGNVQAQIELSKQKLALAQQTGDMQLRKEAEDEYKNNLAAYGLELKAQQQEFAQGTTKDPLGIRPDKHAPGSVGAMPTMPQRQPIQGRESAGQAQDDAEDYFAPPRQDADPAMDQAQDYFAPPRQDAGQDMAPQAPAGQPPMAPSASDAATAGNKLATGLAAQSTLQPTTNVPPRGDNVDPNTMRQSTISGPPMPDATPGQNGAGGAKPRGPLTFGGGQVPQTNAGGGGLPAPLTGPPQPPLGAGQMGTMPPQVAAPQAPQFSPDDQKTLVYARGLATNPKYQSGPGALIYQQHLKRAMAGDPHALGVFRQQQVTDAKAAGQMQAARQPGNVPAQNQTMPTAAPKAPTPADLSGPQTP